MLASACITAALALWAVFTLRDGPLFTLLTMGDHLSIAFRVDGLSCLFAALVSVLWPLACLYAVEYMSREGHENRFLSFYLASFGVTLGIAFLANALTMYLFYELLTLGHPAPVMHAMSSKVATLGGCISPTPCAGQLWVFWPWSCCWSTGHCVPPGRQFGVSCRQGEYLAGCFMCWAFLALA